MKLFAIKLFTNREFLNRVVVPPQNLKRNKAGLENMTNACQGAINNDGIHPTCQKEIEIEITKRIFNEVKNVLNLTRAYTRGGDDVYIEIEPDNLVFVKFLVEADIAVYHGNDRMKIKMTNLL